MAQLIDFGGSQLLRHPDGRCAVVFGALFGVKAPEGIGGGPFQLHDVDGGKALVGVGSEEDQIVVLRTSSKT